MIGHSCPDSQMAHGLLLLLAVSLLPSEVEGLDMLRSQPRILRHDGSTQLLVGSATSTPSHLGDGQFAGIEHILRIVLRLDILRPEIALHTQHTTREAIATIGRGIKVPEIAQWLITSSGKGLGGRSVLVAVQVVVARR